MAAFNGNENETEVGFAEVTARQIEDVPFRLLLLGDWSGKNARSEFKERTPIEIDRDNLDDVLRKLGIDIELDLGGDRETSERFRFEEMDDFHPDAIYRRSALFAELRRTRERLMNPQTFRQAAAELRKNAVEDADEEKTSDDKYAADEDQSPDAGNLLERILEQSSDVSDQKQQSSHSLSGLDALISRLVKPHLVQIDDAEQTELVKALDEATAQLMRIILHHPRFQAVESAWRAIHLLTTGIETDSNLKIFLFDAAREELETDLKSVDNLSESAFYKLLCEKGFDSSSGESWAVVCGNYTFDPHVDDVAMLMRIAKIAEISETPFIAQASPKILGVKSLSETTDSDDWHLSPDSAAGKLWEMLRSSAEASYVGLTIPGFLGRLPYGAKSDPIEEFYFEEMTAHGDNQKYLWINSAFACALLMARSYGLYGWEFIDNLMREIERLPLYIYKDDGQTISKSVTEAAFHVSAAEKIIEHGLMPFVSFRDADRIRLGRFQSIASPPRILKGKWLL